MFSAKPILVYMFTITLSVYGSLKNIYITLLNFKVKMYFIGLWPLRLLFLPHSWNWYFC